MTLYTDAEMTAEATDDSNITVGDTLYGMVKFVDETVVKRIKIQYFAFDPDCCDNELEGMIDKSALTNMFGSEAFSIVEYANGFTSFSFLTFKPVASAKVVLEAKMVKTSIFVSLTAESNLGLSEE